MSERLNLVELERTAEYQKLTQKQQLFVATYCQGGLVDGRYDAVSATLLAYNCKSPEVARIMSYTLMQNIRIIAALNRHFGTTPIEAFLQTLERAIHNKNISLAQIEALRMKCNILGYENRLPTRHKSAHSITEGVRAESAPKKPKKAPAVKKPEPAEPVKRPKHKF
jgi:hypothetical protein